MDQLRIIFFEERPRWEAEMGRRLLDLEVEMRGVRNFSEVQMKPDVFSGGVLVFGMQPMSGEWLLFLGEILERKSALGVIVIRPPGEFDLEWMLREMGVDAVLADQYSSSVEIERYCREFMKKVGAESSPRIAGVASKIVR